MFWFHNIFPFYFCAFCKWVVLFFCMSVLSVVKVEYVHFLFNPIKIKRSRQDKCPYRDPYQVRESENDELLIFDQFAFPQYCSSCPVYYVCNISSCWQGNGFYCIAMSGEGNRYKSFSCEVHYPEINSLCESLW